MFIDDTNFCEGDVFLLQTIFFTYVLRINLKITYLESSRINPGAMFLLIFTVAFLLFLAHAGGSNRTGPIF